MNTDEMSYLGLTSYDEIPWHKVTWRGKALFYLTTCSPSEKEVKTCTQRENMDSGADAELMEEFC